MKTRVIFGLLTVAGRLGLATQPAEAAQTYPEQVLTDAPATYLRLNESFPPVPADLATNAGAAGEIGTGVHSATVFHPVNGALAGDPDGGAAYDGVGAMTQVPWSAAFNPTNAFTVEFWVRVDGGAGTFRGLVTSRSVSPANVPDRGYLFYATSANRWQFRVYNGTSAVILDGSAVVPGRWTHLAGVYDGTAVSFYENGVRVAGPTPTRVAANLLRPLRFGAGATESALPQLALPGVLDEVAVYTNALSAARLAEHYEAATNPAPAVAYRDLVLQERPPGYWRLNEMPPAGPAVVATNLGSLGSAFDGGFHGQVAAERPGVLLDPVDAACGFNGTNAFVEVPPSALNHGPGAFTVEFWARPTGGANTYRFAVASADDAGGATAGYFVHASVGNRWEFWTGFGAPAANNWYVTAGPAVRLDDWQHVVATYDGEVKRLYVDGSLWQATRVPVTNAPASPLRIGTGSTASMQLFPFLGDLDEVAVYPRALVAERVREHYIAARGSNPPAVAPVLALQPRGFTNLVQASNALSVVVYGTPPFVYQWRRDGTNDPGAIGAERVFNPAQVEDSGTYDVVIETAGGSVTSNPVRVSILPDQTPVILEQPRSQTLYAGFPARFSVSATGSLNLTYQWSWNGGDLDGATGRTFVVTSPTPASAGEYSVRVSNPGGDSVTSAPARLTILAPPTGGYPALVLSNGPPVAYWRLDEPPGVTTAMDVVGGHNGAYSRVALGEAGALQNDTNTAVRLLPGGESRVMMADPAAFAFAGTAPFSLAAWVRWDSDPVAGSVARVFSNRRVVGGAGGYGFGVAGATTLRFSAFGVVDVDRPVTVTTGAWHQVVAVRNGTSVQLYWDGAPAGGAATVAMIQPSTQPLQLGRNPDAGAGAESLAALIDEAMVLDRALSADEVGALFIVAQGQVPALVLTRAAEGLRLSWPFGTLEEATNAFGPWQVFTSGVTTLTIPGTNSRQFFRVRNP